MTTPTIEPARLRAPGAVAPQTADSNSSSPEAAGGDFWFLIWFAVSLAIWAVMLGWLFL